MSSPLIFTPLGILLGPMGLSALSGSGPPSPTLGREGEIYVDTLNARLYAAKTADGWSSQYASLAVSTPATIPADLTGNSLVLGPVQGDTTQVALTLESLSGPVFTVDRTGLLTAVGLMASGDAAVGGALTVSGRTQLGALAAQSATLTGDATVGGALTVSGATQLAALTATGPATLGAVTAASLGLSGALNVSGATALAALTATGATVNGNLTVSGTATLGTLLATGLSLSGNLTVSGTSTLGTTTTGALTASSFLSTGATQSTGHFVTSNGTAAAPAFSFTAQQDTGLYLDTKSATAAILALSVNGTQALSLRKDGIAVPGVLGVTGSIAGSSLTLSGTAKALSLSVTQPTGNTGSGVIPAVAFPGSYGTGSYPPSGISSDGVGNLIFSYQGRSVIAFANPGFSGVQDGSSPSTAFGINFTAGAYTFGAGGATALQINTNGTTVIGGGLSGNSFPTVITQQAGTILKLQQGSVVVGSFDVGGNATLNGTVSAAGLALTYGAGKLTFGDGSAQTTAYTSLVANNQTKWFATAQGTAALPAYTFTANTDTGLYLKGAGTAGAILGLSVNAADALLLASGGVTVPGTLSVTGAAATAALTASGAVKAPAFTISATGGALTFADGTTQTTAAGSATAGSAAAFTATGNGTAAAPAYAFANSTGTGFWAIPGGPQLVATVGGTNTLTLNKGSVSVAGPLSASSTLTVTGAATFGSGIAVTGTVVASSAMQASNGSVGAPAYASQYNTNTGIYFGSATGTFSAVYIAANGAQVAAFTAAGNLTLAGSLTATGLSVSGSQTFTGATTHAGTVTSTTAAGTPSFVSSQGFKNHIEMGTYYTYSGTAVNAPTSYAPLNKAVVAQNNAPTFMSRVVAMPYSGSITALSVCTNGSLTAAQTATFVVYVGGVATSLTAQLANGAAVGAYATAYTPVTKGTVPFAAGQQVAVYVKFADASANTAVSADIWVEMGA